MKKYILQLIVAVVHVVVTTVVTLHGVILPCIGPYLWCSFL